MKQTTQTTPGGSKTTQNGKHFEHHTDVTTRFLHLGFEPKENYLEGKIQGVEYKFTHKKDFKRVMKEKYGLEMTREPDEAFIVSKDGSRPILKVLEKKYQSQEGSVDDKLLAGDGIRKQYQRDVGDRFTVEYAFCVSAFIQSFLQNNKGKHTHFVDIITEDYTIPIFFGEESDYFERLGQWIGLTLPNIPPPLPPKLQQKATKPFLKWVGGKQKVLPLVLESFPQEMNNYYEPFLGGGSVLLGLLSAKSQKGITIHGTIYASDANEPLVWVYKNLQSRHLEVQQELQLLVDAFKAKPNPEKKSPGEKRPRKVPPKEDGNREEYYYWIRMKYNELSLSEKCSPRGSAMLWFMNKTCHKGEFRVGPNGYNVPYGHPGKNTEIFSSVHLNEVHTLIQGVHFESCDFMDTLQRVQAGDFVYMDPPYISEPEPAESTPQQEDIPKTKTAKTPTRKSFVGYTQNGFPPETSIRLFEETHRMVQNGANISLSNFDTRFIRGYFPEDRYKVQPIVCNNSVHSKNPGGKRFEVLISNK